MSMPLKIGLVWRHLLDALAAPRKRAENIPCSCPCGQCPCSCLCCG